MFLFLLENIDCGNSLEPPQQRRFEAVLTAMHNVSKEQIRKDINKIHLKIVIFTAVKHRCIKIMFYLMYRHVHEVQTDINVS